jgi:hypothetical protein
MSIFPNFGINLLNVVNHKFTYIWQPSKTNFMGKYMAKET